MGVNGLATLELRDLRKNFGPVEVVPGVNLDVAEHEFVVLVGPSGCGKSTILRMIAGLEEPTSGDIVIDGAVVTQREPKDRDIAMVFQDYALYPHMTVAENMAFALRYRHVKRARYQPSGGRRRADAGNRTAAATHAAAVVRRPTPARRDGPSDRARSEIVLVR